MEYRETANGHIFTHETKRYEKQSGNTGWTYRTICRIDGKLVSRAEYIRKRSIERRTDTGERKR